MITPSTVVVGVQPDLSLQAFTDILEAGSSPALVEVNQCYDAIVKVGVSVAFVTAIFLQESNFGTNGFAPANRNPGNTRTSVTGIGIQVDTVKGKFIRYPSWTEGFRDLAWRLVAPSYVYAQEKRTTIEQIIERFAPLKDGNDTPGYIRSVVSNMNQWIENNNGGGTMQDPTTRVRLIPGHAGRGGKPKRIITLHIQQGYNDLYYEFLNRPTDDQADCTIWSKKDGTLDRFLYDKDSAWTNGDVVAPDMTNPIIAQMVKEGITNTNAYSYTIEHQGFDYEQFTDVQIEATAKMCAYWVVLEGWQEEIDIRIVGHYQVGNHKNCPGPNFPWSKLKARVKELAGDVVYNPNPNNKDVGPGVLEVCTKDDLTIITNEDFFTANKPDALGQRSFTYVKDAYGVTYQVIAIQQVDGNGKPTGPWKRELWKLTKQYD